MKMNTELQYQIGTVGHLTSPFLLSTRLQLNSTPTPITPQLEGLSDMNPTPVRALHKAVAVFACGASARPMPAAPRRLCHTLCIAPPCTGKKTDEPLHNSLIIFVGISGHRCVAHAI